MNRNPCLILSSLSDRDGDEQLTENEFSDLPSEGMGLDLTEDKHESVGGSEDRRKEFRHLIDKNKNGKADRTELLVSGAQKENERSRFSHSAASGKSEEYYFLLRSNWGISFHWDSFQMYIDPRNPRHAIQEAQHLINLSDTNFDGKLNLSEILSKMDLFLGSKMVDTEGSFHDEF